MSVKTNIEKLSYEIRENINKDLEITIENKFGMGVPRYIYPFEIEGNQIKLPFAYATCTLKLKRPNRNEYAASNVKFMGTSRPEQNDILDESIKILSRKGSIMISAYPGFGKCLQKDTPILMYDGSIRFVQNVKVGDLLMGDDSTPRKVLSTCKGQEQMYNIVPIKGDSFGCNESHILSLKLTKINKSTQICITGKLYRKDDVVDISVKDYLKLSECTKNKLKLYRVPVAFSHKEVEIDPYFVGLWLGNVYSDLTSIITTDDKIVIYLNMFAKDLGMKVSCCTDNIYSIYNIVSNNGQNGKNKLFSILQKYNLIDNKHIPHDYKCNDYNTRLSLLAGLIDSNGYYNKNVYEFIEKDKQMANDIIYISRSLGFASFVKEVIRTCNNTGILGVYYLITVYGEGLEYIPVLLDRNKASSHNKVKYSLMSDFEVVPINDKNYYGFLIDKNHRFLLGDFTVTHNTCCSIKLACQIGFKVLIIVNKLVLMKQWEQSIIKFVPSAVVQRLTTCSRKKEADFYIMNAQNVEKMGKIFFADIGTVIVDEAHMIMAETLSRSLQYVYPRYLIGLTATPYRPDGLNILLDLYFGKYKIIRKLWREHIAYKITTGFKPTIEYSKNGRINWNVVLDSQANDVERNELIIKLLRHFSKRNFLVLVKRVSQGEYLIRRLKEEEEDVTSLIGNNQEFEINSRILIGTCQKVGVGFDHPRLDSLLLAADVEEYFVQYLGRVFRTKEVEPIILDLVDNYSILNKHFLTRRKIYQDHGGTVCNFDISELD